jgi:hypothetical protein
MTDRPSDNFAFQSATGRFRNLRTGRFVSQSKLTSLRDTFIKNQETWAKTLAEQVYHGNMSVSSWERAMQDRIKSNYTALYMQGRGGRDAMTDLDRRRLGPLINEQFDYLRGFAQDVMAKDMSIDAIANRSQLYFNGSRKALDKGREQVFKVELPGYPAEGVQCGSNCRCSWEITKTGNQLDAYWIISSAQSCPDCEARGHDWSPFVIELPAGEDDPSINPGDLGA